MFNPWRVVALLTLLAFSNAGAQVTPPLTYQQPISTTPAGVHEVRPLWTLSIDQSAYGEQAVLTTASRVVLKVKGELQARETASGRLSWRVANAGRLLAASEDGVLTFATGQLVSRRPADGRVQWKSALPDIRDVRVSGQTLYVTTMQGALALNATTGKTRWHYADSELTQFGTAASGVVFWQAYKGEPHFPAVVALDGNTGKLLYQSSATLGPLAVKDSQVLFKDFGAFGPDDRAVWSWVDLHSGKVLSTATVQADFQCPGTELYQHGADGFYAEEFYYLNDRCGTRLNQFADTGQASKTTLAPTRTFAAPDDGRYALGPVGEFLVFVSRTGEVRLIPTAGRSAVSLNGVNMPTGMGLVLPGTGPVSRLDVLGGVLYLGRAGGDLLAFDMQAKKPLYSVHLPWRGFAQTFQSGHYAVLTTPGTVAVVRTGQ